MQKIAIIGRPNAGKSSLFNKLLKTKEAIVSDVAGTTRDVKYREVDIDGKPALLLDTGGIEDRDEIFDNVKIRSLAAAAEADIIMFMVDGKDPAADEDKKIFRELARLNKELILVVNKLDNEKDENERLWEFMAFGADELIGISIAHGRNTSKLMSLLCSKLPENHIAEYDDADEFEDILENYDDDGELKEDSSDEIRVAIIGRVNVGKSSLLNALVGFERSVVSSVAGTTIDPVDESIQYEGKKIVFIDTAGIRRKSKIVGIERWALDRCEKTLESADLALLVLDASDDFTELDERIAGYVDRYKTSCIIVLNKWDLTKKEYKEVEKELRNRFIFLSFAPIMAVSAETGRRLEKLLAKIVEIYTNYAQKMPTKKLNDIIRFACKKHQLPSVKGKPVKIVYATQYALKPPTVALVMNRPEGLHFSYRRYLVNQLRENFNLEGTQVVINARKRGERDGDVDGD